MIKVVNNVIRYFRKLQVHIVVDYVTHAEKVADYVGVVFDSADTMSA